MSLCCVACIAWQGVRFLAVCRGAVWYFEGEERVNQNKVGGWLGA